MEAYKQRMIIEYEELKIRIWKLGAMMDKWEHGDLDFTPTCPKYLLDKQLETMEEYAGILQTRAKIEDVDINASVAHAPTEKAGWIPVSKRLPEEHHGFSETVLATVENPKNGAKDTITSYTVNGQWRGGSLSSIYAAKIIAWMPMPEPYAGEENE